MGWPSTKVPWAAALGVTLTLISAPAALAGQVTADYTRTPVLMVHGWFVIGDAGPATWATMKKNLIADGWPEEYLATPSFEYVQGCDPDHAEEIRGWVDDLIEKTGAERVDILSHSEGSLNVMYYLRHFCGVHKVRKLVSLAGAFHGTVTACLDPFSCGTKEMCVGSREGAWKENEVLAELMHGDETPGDTLYTCIWSKYDEVIIPATGGKLVGAQNIECQTPFLEHGGILMSDESYGYVKEALLDGGANEDGPGWDFIPQCAPGPPPEAWPEPLDYPDDAPAADEAVDAETFVEAPSTDVANGDTAAEAVPESESVDSSEHSHDAGATDVWSHFPVTPEGSCRAAGSGSFPVAWLIVLAVAAAGIATRRTRKRR